MTAKKQLGQFFTTNADRILQGLELFIADKNIIDPFAGAGDLLRWAEKHKAHSIRGYDRDRALANGASVCCRDSIAEPVQAEFILTNPPYLYQNKLKDNNALAQSCHTDLYQLALESIMGSDEGIVIVPVNFLSAENAKYIRRIFLEKFAIIKVNYFTEQVFADTAYNIIAFYYRKKQNPADSMTIDFTLYPRGLHTKLTLLRRCNWQIGGDFLADMRRFGNRLGISRLREEDLKAGSHAVQLAYNHLDCRRLMRVCENTYRILKNNIVVLKAIDTGTAAGQICLDDIRNYGCDGLVSIKTSRNQINLIFPSEVSLKKQEKLIDLFNRELNAKRRQYHSLFMTNYRDKDRKRISFNFAYKFISYLYNEALM